MVRRRRIVHSASPAARPGCLVVLTEGNTMTTTVVAPEIAVDRTKVNTAADCEANRTANFASLPMTGDEYIEPMRDDREIWPHGERVKDVTTHPAFRNPVWMTAHLFDAMHTGEHVDTLTMPTDTGSCGVTMMSIDDLAAIDLSYAPPFATVREAIQLAARRLSDRM
jgi:hypothetical protein